jgi:ribose transport system substrate-binding protein
MSDKKSRKITGFVTVVVAVIFGLILRPVLDPSYSSDLSQNLLSENNISQTTANKVPRKYAFNAAFSAAPCWSEPREIWLKLSGASRDVITQYGGPTTGDAAKQIEEIEGLISQKVDGIAIYPGDPKSLVSVIDKAVSKGIPVVTLFADVPESKRLTIVRAVEAQEGRRIMQHLLTNSTLLTQGKSKVIISIANPGIDTQQDRLKGIKEVLALYPQIEIAAIVNDQIDEVKGAEAIHAAMIQNPDAKAVIGLDSRSAIGAISALKELGKKPGEVLVTGWDGDIDVLTGIKNGWINATVVLPVNFMFELGFAILEAYHQGDGSDNSRAKNLRDIPDHVDLPSRLVSAENVAEYL